MLRRFQVLLQSERQATPGGKYKTLETNRGKNLSFQPANVYTELDFTTIKGMQRRK